jgi:hypothetical protein
MNHSTNMSGATEPVELAPEEEEQLELVRQVNRMQITCHDPYVAISRSIFAM